MVSEFFAVTIGSGMITGLIQNHLQNALHGPTSSDILNYGSLLPLATWLIAESF